MNKAKHATLAKQFITDEDRTDWHDETLWWIREKRDKAAHTIVEWEQLRQWASEIKDHTLSMLDDYLIELEKKSKSKGNKVHRATDEAEHNHIIK